MLKPNHYKRIPISTGFMLISMLLITGACNNMQNKPNLKNQIYNDFECYEGWNGISGYYNLKSGDAHSGMHAILTDSANLYSLTLNRMLKDLSEKPIRKIKMSTWLKCQSLPANGSYVLSVEKNGQTLKYFSFDLKEQDAVLNKWVPVQGTAEIPPSIPGDAYVKIYFWNKSKSAGILVDDFQIEFEN